MLPLPPVPKKTKKRKAVPTSAEQKEPADAKKPSLAGKMYVVEMQRITTAYEVRKMACRG